MKFTALDCTAAKHDKTASFSMQVKPAVRRHPLAFLIRLIAIPGGPRVKPGSCSCRRFLASSVRFRPVLPSAKMVKSKKKESNFR